MHLCLSRLGWAPQAMWRATPREIALALGPLPQDGLGEPMGRGRLDALMRRFPD